MFAVDPARQGASWRAPSDGTRDSPLELSRDEQESVVRGVAMTAAYCEPRKDRKKARVRFTLLKVIRKRDRSLSAGPNDAHAAPVRLALRTVTACFDS